MRKQAWTVEAAQMEATGPSLSRFGLSHTYARMTGAPVVPVPGPGYVRAGGPATIGSHRNSLQRSDYDLPDDRFARYLNISQQNLIDVIESAALPLSVDGVVVVRPLGSLTYARDVQGLDWDLVRDLDIWVLMTGRSIAGKSWLGLHRKLQDLTYQAFQERGLWVHQSEATGNVYLRDESGLRRMIELKIADLNWLKTGLIVSHRRRSHLLHRPRPAHFDSPRLEWASYTPHENYFVSHAGSDLFRSHITSIREVEMHYGRMHTYAENLAEGFRALSPSHLVGALNQRRLFFRYTRKALKKELMLKVMLGDEPGRRQTVELLQQMKTGQPMVESSSSRYEFIGERVAALRQLQQSFAAVSHAEVQGNRVHGVPVQRTRIPEQVEAHEKSTV